MIAPTCWIITDGKAGDLVQCQGVAEAMGLAPVEKVVAPRAPWVWAMPWGPVDPAEAPGRPGGPLQQPFPDIAFASGRRTVPSLRALKAASGGRTFTVFLKDPRVGKRAADFIWVPEHDRLRGPNVLATLTSPHRVSQARLAEAAQRAGTLLPPVASPRVALLLGGDSRHYLFTETDRTRFMGLLRSLVTDGVGIMATASRRSPPALAADVKRLVAEAGGYFWDGTGENPYLAMLATADAVVATADSVNMLGEACATGRPVLVFEPGERRPGSARKVKSFISALISHGAVRWLQGHLESYAYVRIDSTPVIADAVTAAFARHQTMLNGPG